MVHLGSGHRSVTAHSRFPRAEKGGELESKKQKQNLYKDARYARYPASIDPREDPDSSENIRGKSNKDDELEKRLTGKHDAAAHEESEILERKHTMTPTAAATNDEADETGYRVSLMEFLRRASASLSPCAKGAEKSY